MRTINSKLALAVALSTAFLPSLVVSQEAQVTKPEFPSAPESVRTFLQDNCYDCHVGESAEAGFDLESLSDELSNGSADQWTRIFDRVHDGEMPPADYGDLEDDVRSDFLESTGQWMRDVESQQAKLFGRVPARRLTNLQLERTLHDLLGINIPLENRMPDEPRTGGFTTVAKGQAMSHFQLKQHVDIVDLALDNAFERAFTRKPFKPTTLSAKEIARPKKRRRSREPELIDEHAVTWNGQLPYYGKVLKTAAPEDGWYQFKIKAKGLKIPEGQNGVWCTIRSGRCDSSAPLMTWVDAFEAGQDLEEITVVAWLLQDHMIEIRPADASLKKGYFKGGQIETGKGEKLNIAGVAIKSIQMQRVEPGGDNDAIRNLLFANERVSYGRRGGSVKPENPEKTLRKLLYRFAKKAFRRPIKKLDVAPYVEISSQKLAENGDFVDALRVGYRSILCSPRFMYFHEAPGKLDDFSIAARLSYLLWNRMLDEELWSLAAKGKLSDKDILRQQVDRMLDDPRAENFVVDLADQWLDMNLIDFTQPDRKLYPGFDPIVEKSMLDETHAYLQEMLDKDLSVSLLIDSNFTFLNSRLADYYGLGEAKKSKLDDQIRKFTLSKSSQRGGLITQGSIMKVTANGSTTSPVLRGVWISERLLGQPIPPPPENVPAIEPDIRGATTIREMLAKHKSDDNCAACHRKIDPPGFALENYDPSGRWRTHYGRKRIKNKKKRAKLRIDAGFEMPDGTEFKNLAQFKKLVLKDKKKLAANVVEKLLTYGTGATIRFADRETVEHCVSSASRSKFGFRSLLKEVVTSDLFLTK